MDEIEINLANCNNIDEASFGLRIGALNIKFGPNGIGKSTLSRALISKIRNDGKLQDLLPFKHRRKGADIEPSVDGVGDIKTVSIFDETYVQQFVFQKDEVVRNSFDIFIRTPEYAAEMAEIEEILAGLKGAFSSNDEIDQVVSDLKELRDAFGKPSKGGSIPKNSKMHKAFGAGNKVDNVPESLKPYEVFIRSQEPAKWIAWQIKGNEFIELGENCPYCATPFQEKITKETALSVAKEYDVSAVNHLNTLKSIIDRLGKYFSESCQNNLEKITKAKVEITAQESAFLVGLKADIDALIEKLEGLRSMSFFSLRDVDELEGKLRNLKIDLSFMDKLDSEETRKTIDPINDQLTELIGKVSVLKGKINKHKAKIKKTIEENQKSVNGFLKSAGYKYEVQIVPEPATYRMKLVHVDSSDHIETAGQHLSYGERNAFSLVLFMHQVLSENPDLVILDDPVSSFDKNKKFAILNELFRGKASLRGRTTLMLTHDIEPAIDVILSVSGPFEGARPSVAFLSSRSGVLKEVPIERSDIKTFNQICSENIRASSDALIKAIYLRREYELRDEKGLVYNLLASLFKGRPHPSLRLDGSERAMTAEEIGQAEEEVRREIPEFDYAALVLQAQNRDVIKDKYNSTDVGYEKVQLFRVVQRHPDDVIAKFINEAYHIENEYVMQLNPTKFEIVPEYIIDECSRLLESGAAAVTT